MIWSDGLVKSLAFGAAVAGHLLVLGVLFDREPVETEGSMGGVTARLGNSFADVAASVAPPDQPEVTEPFEAEEAPLTQTQTEALKPLEPPKAAEVVKAVESVKPTPEVVKPVPQKEEPQKPVEKPTPKPKPKPAVNSAALAGQADGAKDSKTVSAGTAGKSKQAGNAAVSNYPGQVMRRLQRISRPRMRTKGRALVAFTIAANGQLQSVKLSKSSGSAKLDQAALKIIRKAAPFPKPPSGAQRSYSIYIESR